MTTPLRAVSSPGAKGSLGSSSSAPARYRVWRLITATSADFAQLARRYGELDAEGDLRVGEPLERTAASSREPNWRKLDGPELTAAERSGTSAGDDRKALELLRRGIHRRLDQLVHSLRELDGAAALSQASWSRIEQALRIHFDERILERLPNYLRPSWTRLHRTSSNGGVDFYRDLDEDLVDRTQPSLVFEVYYYCFRHDFVGRCASDPQTIARYLSRLEERIDFTVPDRTAAPIQKHRALRRPWPVRRYYVVALLSALLIALVSLWLSNRSSERSSEPAGESFGGEGDPVEDTPREFKHRPLCSGLGMIGVWSVGPW